MINQNPFTEKDLQQIRAISDLLRRVEEETFARHYEAVEVWLASRLTPEGLITVTCCGDTVHPNAVIHVIADRKVTVEGQRVTLTGIHWLYCNACMEKIRLNQIPGLPPGGVLL